MAERALSGRLDRMVDTILARGDATAALQIRNSRRWPGSWWSCGTTRTRRSRPASRPG